MTAAAWTHAGDDLPSDAEIRDLLRQRIEVARRGFGMVVGLVDEHGTRVVSCGRFERDHGPEVNGDTVFEIGSTTKVFTAALLQDMIERGLMKLDDPASKYLPKSVHLPVRGGKEITLLNLVTHTSGLPRMPENFAPKDEHNPYADYTVEQLYACLSGCTLARDIGAKYEYSNLGSGLLGHILTLKAGRGYESLVVDRICRPLKMNDTGIKLDARLKARLAPGHTAAGALQANWDLPTLAGAGALRSTVNDLLKFIAANIGLTRSSLTPLLQKTHAIRFRGAAPDLDVALAWHVGHKFGTDLVWHNGETGGYHAFMGFDPAKRRGVVLLSNSAGSIDDIACHLLVPQYKVSSPEPPKAPAEAKIDFNIYSAYEGRYEMAPGVFFTIRRNGNRLMAQLTG